VRAVLGWTRVPLWVARAGILHVDDLGTEVGKKCPCKRSCNHMRELDDLEAIQCTNTNVHDPPFQRLLQTICIIRRFSKHVAGR
jgi:hypothetical protein